jgi:hypothetical protein
MATGERASGTVRSFKSETSSVDSTTSTLSKLDAQSSKKVVSTKMSVKPCASNKNTVKEEGSPSAGVSASIKNTVKVEGSPSAGVSAVKTESKFLSTNRTAGVKTTRESAGINYTDDELDNRVRQRPRKHSHIIDALNNLTETMKSKQNYLKAAMDAWAKDYKDWSSAEPFSGMTVIDRVSINTAFAKNPALCQVYTLTTDVDMRKGTIIDLMGEKHGFAR